MCGNSFTYLPISFSFGQSSLVGFAADVEIILTEAGPGYFRTLELSRHPNVHSTMSHLLEVIPMKMLLLALPSRCPSPAVKTLVFAWYKLSVSTIL